MAAGTTSEEADRRMSVLRSRWPPSKILLLADVGLADPDTARASWLEWQAQSDLDTTPWVEIRAIAAATERIVALMPETPNLSRIKGFRRFIFINGQRTFSSVRPMLSSLADAGVDMMLLKGAARIASNSSAAAARFVGDVDVLVRLEDRERAWQVARERGWHLNRRLAPMAGGSWEGQSVVSHALDFTPSPDIQRTVLDLHHFSRSLCRNEGDDDAMWAQASKGKFLGLDIHLPSRTDQLRHTLTHALMHAGSGRAIDWIFDSAELLKDGLVDWSYLTAETLASSTQAFVGAALLLLKERLELGVPERVLATLIEAVAPPFEHEFVFRTSAYYRDLRLPQLIDGVVASATHRADAAAARVSASTKMTSWWLERTADGNGKLVRGRLNTFPVPEGLRRDETVRIVIAFKTGAQAGQLSITTPILPLRVWQARWPRRRKRIVRSVAVRGSLLLMTRSRLIGLRWTGPSPLEDIEVSWVRGPRVLRSAARLVRRVFVKVTAAWRRPSS